jgi:GNAT superfamily N-acetyltransferase
VNDDWVVEEGGRPIGAAGCGHPAWANTTVRATRMYLAFPPGPERGERIARTLSVLEPYAIGDGADVLACRAREDQADELAAYEAAGYREERRSRSWELDLAANRERIARMAEAARARMRDEGIEITTADRIDDPEKWVKLHRMVEESVQDIPTTIPHARESLESFMQWVNAPGVHLDRLWIAREGEAIVGMSLLSYPPGPGNVWTSYTGTARSVRGRGVARALKCETVMQAIALGTPRVRTNNDGQNAPILHLNEEMGYVRIPGNVQLLKRIAGAAA